MDTENPTAKHPAAWLRPTPDDYKFHILRWIFLPATTWAIKRRGGVWISGELTLTVESLLFAQSMLIKSSRMQPVSWSIPLKAISNVEVKKAVASETLELRWADNSTKLLTLRSADFVAKLIQAVIDRARL